jgi:hypothetical protein
MATSATSKLPPVPVLCSDLVQAPGMTRTTRLLVTQEARVVVVVDCPCRIQLVTPPSKDIFIAIDEEPADLGPNRMPYLSCPLPTDAIVYPVKFLPGQKIVLATRKGVAICGIFIERLAEGATS